MLSIETRERPRDNFSYFLKMSAVMVIISLLMARFNTIKLFFGALWEIFLKMFMENQFLQGMLVPGFLSILSYGIFKLYLQVDRYLRTNLLRSVTIKKQDDNYDTVVSYISKKYAVNSQSYVAETYVKKRKSWKEWRQEFMTGKSAAPKFCFRPSDSSGAISFFRYQGHRIMMVRTKGNTVTVGHARQPLVLEELTLTCWGRDSTVLISILNEALEDLQQEENDELNIWVLAQESWIGGWEKAMSKAPRAKESVILDHNLADSLISDARRFQQSVQWYSERGIPYRRGYLLHGPPGTGKTSFCQVLAGELKLDMCMLTLADSNMTDSKLASSLRDAPKNAIIMIEDVDSIFVERKSVSGGKSDGVTFSGFLNAIDGVASQEGRILIMTTNHLDRLDAALVRPGRCDVKAELTNASKDQAKQLFVRFFPQSCSSSHNDHDRSLNNTSSTTLEFKKKSTNQLALSFMSKIPEYEISMASLQGHLLKYRDSPEQAIEHVHEILKSHHQRNTKAKYDKMNIFDHLRRVGLEKYAYAFECYGYITKQDMSTLTIETIKSWIVELKYDDKSADRFNKLLTLDSELMQDYIMCDVPTIKELFWQIYSSSSSSSAAAVQHNKNTEEAKTKQKLLLNDLCQIIVPEGKGLASVWQLKWHLRVYSYSVEDAVKHAYLMVESRENMTLKCVSTIDLDEFPPTYSKEQSSRDVKDENGDISSINNNMAEKALETEQQKEKKEQGGFGLWMTTFQWCHRVGVSEFQACAQALEGKGYKLARDFQHLTDLKEITDIGFGPKHAKTAKVLIENRPENGQAHILEGYKLLDFLHAKQEFMNYFTHHPKLKPLNQPTTTCFDDELKVEKLAIEFAHCVTDRLGFGLISLNSCLNYFKQVNKDNIKEMVTHIEKELISIKRYKPKPKPIVPERTDWIVGWLKSASNVKEFEPYINNFIAQDILTEKDLLCPNPISEDQLNDVLGVKKLGHRRKLLAMIQALQDKP